MLATPMMNSDHSHHGGNHQQYDQRTSVVPPPIDANVSPRFNNSSNTTTGALNGNIQSSQRIGSGGGDLDILDRSESIASRYATSLQQQEELLRKNTSSSILSSNKEKNKDEESKLSPKPKRVPIWEGRRIKLEDSLEKDSLHLARNRGNVKTTISKATQRRRQRGVGRSSSSSSSCSSYESFDNDDDDDIEEEYIIPFSG